ncbi:Sulfurtransferase OS=Xanthomonas axonopodis pv. phaseoli GN=PK63_13445 PE=4 SV=1 [Gemmata massiliana]|uniref:Sulfurtransferase n=2 Tax=Gemmata massiliana TaxID=1210884 RepID=A0A6P2D237_9BACT|nr:Sulfurtransferase OS=Xanthomonas axonopodis pv. phaseoli GN=PK63_13445 PE=4 SV=1 [Gemmata massiliana]
MVEQHSITEGTLDRLRAAQADIREEYLADNTDPWIIGFSGSKDRTLVTQLVFEMLLDIAPSDRKRPIHVLCNDTLVESPVLMAYVDRMLDRLQTAADNLHLPIKGREDGPRTRPDLWVTSLAGAIRHRPGCSGGVPIG